MLSEELVLILEEMPNSKLRFTLAVHLDMLTMNLGSFFDFDLLEFYIEDENDKIVYLTIEAKVNARSAIVYGDPVHYSRITHTLGLPTEVNRICYISPSYEHVSKEDNDIYGILAVLGKLGSTLKRKYTRENEVDGYRYYFAFMLNIDVALSRTVDTTYGIMGTL